MSQPRRQPRRRPDPRTIEQDICLPPSPSDRQFTSDGRMPTATMANFWMPCGVCCRPINQGETATLSLSGTTWYHPACAERPTMTVIEGAGSDNRPKLPLLESIPGGRLPGYPPGLAPIERGGRV